MLKPNFLSFVCLFICSSGKSLIYAESHIYFKLLSLVSDNRFLTINLFSAAWRALRDVFPGTTIKGCVFHWNQAVWRHVQQFGLAATYQLRQGMYDYIRQLMALPFLPARHIRQTFDHLKTKANTPPLQQLVDYMDRQWFQHAVFDVSSWCVFRQAVRTNNDVEGNQFTITLHIVIYMYLSSMFCCSGCRT